MKRELNKYSDARLALRMVKYIELARSITVQCEYYDNAPCPEEEKKDIQKSYARLKKALREDAYYLGFSANDNDKSSVYMNAFKPSVLHAAAWGMAEDENAQPGNAMGNSVQKALDGFTKHLKYEEWKFLSEQES